MPETSDSASPEPLPDEEWDQAPLPPFIVPELISSSRVSASTSSSPSPSPVLRVIGPYQVLRELGRGGMGIVYEAIERPLDRRVALKVLPFSSSTDKPLADRLLHEARIVARLDHPHIVKVHGSGEVEGVPFIAFQLIDGHSLRPQSDLSGSASGSGSDSVARRWERLATLGRDAASALQHAHENGIIHRDVKPSNLLLDRNGKIWVADFGLARAAGISQLTATGDLLGTLRYMSPEQAIGQRGLVDARTDIYSLGVVLYELATQAPLFENEDRAALLRRILSDLPKPVRRVNPSIPRDLAVIIGKAIAKYPADRYATAGELAADLDRFLERRPIVAVPPSVWDWSRYYARKHRTLLTISMIGLFAVLLGWNLLSQQHSYELQQQIDQLDQARKQATRREWDSLVTLAERGRLTPTPGRRQVSLRALRDAARLVPSEQLSEPERLRLRDDLIATLAIPLDLELEGTVEYTGTIYAVAIDEQFRHAIRHKPGTTLVELFVSQEGTFHSSSMRTFETGRLDPIYYWIAPDGHRAVISGPDADVPSISAWRASLWDLESGKSLRKLPVSHCSAWSRDGQRLAIYGSDSWMRIISAATGEELAAWQSPKKISDLDWLPGGEELGLMRDRHLVRVRADSGAVVDQQPCPFECWQLNWHESGRLVTLNTVEEQVVVWNYAQKQQHASLKTDLSRHLVAPSQGDYVATVPSVGDTTIWDVKSGKALLSVPERAVAFHQDGTRFATCGNRSLSTWSMTRSNVYRSYQPVLHESQEVTDADISPDGRWLIVASDAGVSFINLSTQVEQSIPRPGTRSAQFVRSGNSTALVVSDSQVTVQEYPFDTDRGELGQPKSLYPKDASPVWGIGHAQVTAGDDWIAVVDAVTRPVAIQRSTGRSKILADRPNLWNAAASPDGRWLAGGTYQGRGVDLWDIESEKIVRQVWDAAINSRCEFSPDGRWLAVTTSHEFRVFDTNDWSVVFSQYNTDAFYTTVPLAFTPDGQYLLMSDNQIDLHILRVGTWKKVATLRGPDTGVHGVAHFSADGHWLVRTSGSQVHVWNIGRLRLDLEQAGVDW